MIKLRKFKFDFILVLLLSLLFLVSLVTLFYAEKILLIDNLIERQIMWYIIGFLLLFFIIKTGNEKIYKYTFVYYIILNILLFLLLFIAKPINNARCWFNIPRVGTFQPSEFMKIIWILVLANVLVRKDEKEFRLLIRTFLLLLVPALLTFLEPDTGVVLIYLIITFIMLYTSGIKKRWFIIFFATIILFTVFVIYMHNSNSELFLRLFGNDFFLRIDRLFAWKDKSGYQLNNSLIAIGSGGLFGSSNSLYIPESQTDFIFAIYASKFGFMGSVFLLLLFFLFDLKIIFIGKGCEKNKDKFVISGILGMLIYQQIQNVGMTIGLMPITGITLPFISYGGSSLLSYMIMMGIVFNISSDNIININLYGSTKCE